MATQSGQTHSSADRISRVDVEIMYGGYWVSLNDHIRYVMHTDGFGKRSYAKKRKTVSSEFFDGEYITSETRENSAASIAVWVLGGSVMELEENIDTLTAMFGQRFSIRTRVNEIATVETSAGSADFIIDQSHIYMHNMRALVTCNFSLLPGAVKELIL